MRLHSPTFSRAFRKLLRAERRRNPALRRAMRRARRPRAYPNSVGNLIVRALFGLFPVFVLFAASHGSHRPVLFGPVIASWWSLEVLVLGRNVVQTFATNWPPPLLFLPFVRSDFLRMSRHNVYGLAWRPFCDALWMLGALAIVSDAGIAGWLTIVPLAAIGALATWSAAVWLTKWKMSGWVVLAAMAFPFLLFFLAKANILWTWLYHVTNLYGAELTLLSPGGWTAAAFLCGLGKLPAVWWLVLVPLVVLAASAPLAWASLLQRLDPEQKLTATWLHVAVEEGEDSETPGSLEKTAPAAAPLPSTAEFAGWWRANPLSFADCGWMERLFLRWLAPRERLVLECSVSKMPRWTRWTRRSLLFLAVAALCLFLLRHLPWAGAPLGFAGAISGIIGLCSGLPLASGFDQMFGRVNVYGVRIARPALLPINPREFQGLVWKAAAIRGASMLPVLAVLGAFLAWQLKLSHPLSGALLGAKLAVLSVASAPFFSVMAISAASNDSQRGGMAGLHIAGFVLLTVLVLVPLLIASFAAPLVWAIPALALFAVVAWGGAHLYVRNYNRGRFDLVQVPRSA